MAGLPPGRGSPCAPHAFSKAAAAKIEAAGGRTEVLPA
jgi:ribosomal protein L15